MLRTQMLAVVAGVGFVFCGAAPAVSGAPFAVYYRSSATGPWTFYAGKDSKTAAQATAAELKELGYLTEIINDAEKPPATIVHTKASSTTVVNRGGSASSYSGFSSSSWSQAGGTVSTAVTHHWDHQHEHQHALREHPTQHPHHTAHHHEHKHNHPHAHHAKKAHGHHGHHHGGHHAHHHGGHHKHHHAHHHSHGHHHK